VSVPTWVGRRLPRLDDPAILRGEGRYAGDVALGATWHAVFVRSTVAAGRLLGVTAPAGVHLLTAADIPAAPIRAALHRPDYALAETPVLAGEVVRFVGEPVAVVLGRTPAEAEDAAELVDVDIEPLPPVLDANRAVAPDAPRVHDIDFPGDPNTVVDGRIATPNFDAEWNGCERHVAVQVVSRRQSAVPIETRGSVAEFDRRSGRVTLTTSTQMPHLVRTGVCESLGIPDSDLRVIAPDVGGAFGGKMALAREDIVLVHLARHLRASVAWTETRSENFMAAWHSREQVYQVVGGFRGLELVAVRADIVADVGAYSCYPVTYGVEPLMAMAELPGPYAFRHYSVRSRAVLTNKCPIAPYRGVSRPVQTLAMERLMDTAAREMGVDPWELRRVNLVHDFPHRSPSGVVYDAGSYLESLDVAERLAERGSLAARKADARERGRRLGQGIAVFSERTGYGSPAFAARGMAVTPGYERVELAMDPSGIVTARVGASPHGQGLSTALAQLIADQVGIEPTEVRVISGDTDVTPFGWGSFASRSMVITGGATALAAADLAGEIKVAASALLECAPEDLRLVGGRVVVAGSDEGIAIAEVARSSYLAVQKHPGRRPGLYADGAYDPAGTFSNACHLVEVEVDVETGGVEIVRFVVVEDAGILINPAIVDGQIHGGVAQGIANALLEELVYDEQGTLLTTSFLDYLPPTSREIPTVEIHHLRTVTDASLTGAKGVGEGGTIGAPAAILNALTDALAEWGIDVNEMPATPGKLREALREKEGVG
jgi:carbon-monoxide dehydrogenase large subunit